MSANLTVRALIASMALPLVTVTAIAQTYTPYSHFQQLSSSQMGRVQAKITFVGTRRLTLMSLAFSVQGNPMNLGLFVPFRRPGYS